MNIRPLSEHDYTRQRWKNGGGFTTELAIHREGVDRWLWRLSVAEVEQFGDFSDFSGYERTIMLLAGNGMELVFDGNATRRINALYRPFVFDGSCKTYCRLLDGPVTDMNLIVDRGRATGVMSVLPVDTTERVEIAFPWVVLYCLNGAVSITAAGRDHRLDRGESFRIDGAAGSTVGLRASGSETSIAIIGVRSQRAEGSGR